MAIALGAAAVTVAPLHSSVTVAADPTFEPIVLADTVDTDPLVSDDGALVLLQSSTPIDPATPDVDAITTLQLHDRRLGTTVPLADAGATWAAISGDGCLIAYAVPVADVGDGAPGDADPADPAVGAGDGADVDDGAEAGGAGDGAVEPGDAEPPEYDLRIVDRCAGATGAVGLESTLVTTMPVVAPIALDRRGTTMVVNGGADVVRFARTLATETDPGTGFSETHRFDLAPVATADSTTAGPVDVSDDGTVVVYQATAAIADRAGADAVPSIMVWENGTVATLVADGSDPSVSGAGDLVAVRLGDSDPATPTGVAVIDRSVDGAPLIVPIADNGERPRLASGGAHLVYSTPTGDTPGLHLASWTGPGTSPFETVTTTDLGVADDGGDRFGVPAGTAGISRSGDAIVFDDPVSGDVIVRIAPASVAFVAGQYDLGTGVVGTELSTAVTIVNDGTSTVDLSSATVAAGSPFVVVAGDASTSCIGELRPGATCTVEVGYQVAAPIDVSADMTVTLAGADSPAAVTRLSAVGAAETTTTGATTTTQATTGTVPNTTPTTRPNTTPNTRPNTTRVTTRPTVATTTIVPAPAFAPATFDFAPTIVGAGRRVASLAITNPSSAEVTVVDVLLDAGDTAFAIEPGSDCPGASLASGATCRVDVSFTPAAEGQLSAVLTAQLSDGSSINAGLTGVGAPTPTVAVVPNVASPGQVVTVRGSGFPAGSLVELAVGSEATPRILTVTDVGTFDLPIVILPNTLPGPLDVTVSGQPDLFPTVETSLLVTVTSDRTSPAVLRGAGPNIGR